MNCHEINERLEAYALGALEAEEQAEVERHLAVCPEHQPELQALAEVVHRLPEALAAASPLRPPETLKVRLLESLENSPASSPPLAEAQPRRAEELTGPPRSAAPARDGRRSEAPSRRPLWGWLSWWRPRTVTLLLVSILLVLAVAWGARLSVVLAEERALRSELASLVGQQEIVLEVVDSEQTVRRVLLPPDLSPNDSAPPYGKLFTRPDMPHVVAMIARLPQPPPGQAYHLWLTRQDQVELAGTMSVNEDGFSLLVFDEELAGPGYDSAQLTLQPENSTAPSGQPILVWERSEE